MYELSHPDVSELHMLPGLGGARLPRTTRMVSAETGVQAQFYEHVALTSTVGPRRAHTYVRPPF